MEGSAAAPESPPSPAEARDAGGSRDALVLGVIAVPQLAWLLLLGYLAYRLAA